MESPIMYGEFSQCRNGEPGNLAVSEHFTDCNLYTTGGGARAARIVFTEEMFVDNVNTRKVTITWAVA